MSLPTITEVPHEPSRIPVCRRRCHRSVASPVIFRKVVRHAGQHAAFPAGVPAWRLRLQQSAGAARQRFLLRVAADAGHRATRSGQPRQRDRAGWGLGPEPGVARLDLPVVATQADRLRAVRRHRRSVAQPFRNAGQHRIRRAHRASRQFPFRLSRPPGRGIAGRAADRVHQIVAAEFPGRHHGRSQHLAEGRHQAAFRRAPVGDPHPDVPGHLTGRRHGGWPGPAEHRLAGSA